MTQLARDEALAYATRAEDCVADLDRLHSEPVPNRTRIARVHQELRVSLKLAEVHATLAVAEQLAGLRGDRDPQVAGVVTLTGRDVSGDLDAIPPNRIGGPTT